MNTATTPPAACPNCGEVLLPRANGQPPSHCPACGQETHVRPPKLGEFIQQFGGAYFATEGALWRTLKLLLIKPGELTAQYLAGRRKHYVLPLRLYLSISLVTILLLRLTAGAGMDVKLPADLDFRKGEWTLVEVDSTINAGLKDGVFFCRGLPQWFCRRLERRLDTDPKGLQREAEQLPSRLISNFGGAMFVMLPLFAFLQWLVWWGRRLRYTEHLVFALHLHAFWFLCLLLTLLPFAWLPPVAAVLVPVYAMAALKRVYGGRWVWVTMRASLVSLLYLLVLSFGLLFVLLWSMLF